MKAILLTATILTLLGAFAPAQAQKSKQGTAVSAKTDLKFLDNISISLTPAPEVQEAPLPVKKVETGVINIRPEDRLTPDGEIEKASSLQFKYALLMNLEVEQIRNLGLFRLIDDWFGTKYKLGGTSKAGIDCSALMQVFFTALYGVALPRTAREQYNFSRRISRTELREGDLVFFNTLGGVSHVGMYLGYNKFVHASSSGVTISDLYEEYYLKRFIGVGRVEGATESLTLTTKP